MLFVVETGGRVRMTKPVAVGRRSTAVVVRYNLQVEIPDNGPSPSPGWAWILIPALLCKHVHDQLYTLWRASCWGHILRQEPLVLGGRASTRMVNVHTFQVIVIILRYSFYGSLEYTTRLSVICAVSGS